MFLLLLLLLLISVAYGKQWFLLTKDCYDGDLRIVADVRGYLEDDSAIGVFENKDIAISFANSLKLKCEKKFQLLGDFIENTPAMIIPSASISAAYIDKQNIIAYIPDSDSILVQGSIDQIVAQLPSTIEPQFLNNRKMNPLPSPFNINNNNVNNVNNDVRVKNDKIQQLVDSVSTESIILFLEDLTNGFHTRLSTSNDVDDAADFLISSYEERNISVVDEFSYSFPVGYPPNIIAQIRGVGNPEKYVILGAHYDDRAQNINDVNARAPGANDDGSGTAALLEAARVIGTSGLRFNYTILFASFSGEEQGLYGSNAYADYLYSIDTDIVAMIQSDMIAHKFPQNPNKMELSSRYASEDLNVEVEAISNMYVPSLEVGRTTACCSDQQPFYENGYYATALVEAGGYTIDPQYHTTTDVMYRDDYSFEQLTLICQVLIATCATFAQPL